MESIEFRTELTCHHKRSRDVWRWSAGVFLVFTLVSSGCSWRTSAQTVDSVELARLLADPNTRATAITQLTTSRRNEVPVLLAWSQNPPKDVDQHSLFVGLAEAFGQLRTVEAIPYLIKNISRRRIRYVELAPWGKTDEVIKQAFPAVAALIQIGPDASRAAMTAARGPTSPEDRLACIFVISSVKGVPEKREFLNSMLGYSNHERLRAEEGLRLLSEEH